MVKRSESMKELNALREETKELKRREHENPDIEYEVISGYLQDETKYQDAEVQKEL